MGRHSFPDDEPAQSGDGSPPSGRLRRADSGWQGRRRRQDSGPREVSRGVIAALIAVVVLVGGVIAWRFFGDALSRRSSDAANVCVEGTAKVGVVADPSIAEAVSAFADRFNDKASPIGDKCVKVAVTKGDSDAVLRGLTGTWPAELGERPALWLPASSVQSARLQAAAGKQIVSDARSLVNSPVLLAVRPQLKTALGQDGWTALPALQNDPAVLDGRDLAGWGGLRLALPTAGSADATYLVAEAVAAAAAPPNTAPTAGLGAVSALITGQPQLPDHTADQAWQALTGPGDPASAPVHAVAMTEQQLFSRTSGLDDAAETVAAWRPTGRSAVADYPTALLAGQWLSEEQVAAASEFARFMRKPEQLDELAKAGFRSADSANTANDVVDFPALEASLPAGDDALRAAVAATVAPAGVATTTVMLNQAQTGVAGAVKDRIGALPPGATVGLWTFTGAGSGIAVPTGPLSEDMGGSPRGAALAGALDGLSPTGGGVSFTTLRLVYGDALANFRPGQPNSVLVITGGPHTDRTLDGPGLQEFIRSALDRGRPVAVNVITVGDDPDRSTWEAVSQLSGGVYQNVPAADSPDLLAALARTLT